MMGGSSHNQTYSEDAADKQLGKLSKEHKLSDAVKDSKVVSGTLKDLEDKASR